MDDEKFRNIFDILNDIAPHSEEVRKFLLTRQYYNKKSSEKTNTVEHAIENIIENKGNKNPEERNLILNNEDSKLRELEAFLEENKDLDLDMNIILNRLNEIENEIKAIREEDKRVEEIEKTKIDREDRNKIEKEEIKNKEKEEKEKEKEKDRLDKKEEEQKTARDREETKDKEKEETINRLEKEKQERDRKLKEEKERKEMEELSKKEKEKQELREKEKRENKDLENKKSRKDNPENKLSSDVQKNNEEKEKIKKLLESIGASSNNIEDKGFIDKVVKDKENIQNAKDILKANSLENTESARQKADELDNKIQELQSIIDLIISSGETPPPDLLAELQNISSLKANIEGAINIISSSGLTR